MAGVGSRTPRGHRATREAEVTGAAPNGGNAPAVGEAPAAHAPGATGAAGATATGADASTLVPPDAGPAPATDAGPAPATDAGPAPATDAGVAAGAGVDTDADGRGTTEAADVAGRDQEPGAKSFRGFLGWGAAAYLAVTGLIVALALRHTGGRVVYVLDDPAIHLSVARNLADHGTWGAVAGHYESASSSPLWTVLLAAATKVVPGTDGAVPLALNVAAALGVIAVFAAGQRVLAPSRRRPADVLAVAAFVVVLLFLPGLTLVGMEHTLHVALVLAAVVLFHREERGLPRVGPRWLPYVVLGLATLTRFETAFVAFALAVAFLLAPRPEGTPLARRLGRPVLVGLSSLLPLLAYGGFNRAMGQGWLPNSVLAKSTVENDTGLEFVRTAFERLNTDPLVAGLAATCVVALVLAGRRWTPYSLPAIVTVVTVAIHALLARFGWYERYQAYLVALGAYALFAILADRLPAVRLPPARSFAVAGIVGALLILSDNKPGLTTGAADGVAQTYEQRYQLGRFMERYYDGQPVATGELGYVSLDHDGPLTDLFGLGDHEVMEAWRRAGGTPPAEFWSRLADERGFGVVAVYPLTLFPNAPADWITVGTWVLDREVTTAPDRELIFMAADPEAVAPLADHLAEFQEELPPGVQTHMNPLAEYQADLVMAGQPATGAQPPAAGPPDTSAPAPDGAAGT